MIYDIFYVSRKEIDNTDWMQFRQRFPSAQKLENVSSLNDIRKKSFTKFFWVVWNDIVVNSDFDFSYRVDKWDEDYIHVWLNGTARDGICLFPKTVEVLQKEFDHRFYFNKKEIDVVASNPIPYDIVFISYNEPNADDRYNTLLQRFPRAKRVHGVKGIHQAHIEAAKLSKTPMFWVVDADAIITDDFTFDFEYYPYYDAGNRQEHHGTVYVWASKNPINDLVYGYGGVKLFPTDLALSMDTTTTDMTTSISKKFKLEPKVSNITAFNIDEFSTWKSAFRECVKLTSKVIDRNYREETEERLEIWCKRGAEAPFGEYAIAGARAGYRYGLHNIGDAEKLSLINDFDWVHAQFLQWQESNGQ